MEALQKELERLKSEQEKKARLEEERKRLEDEKRLKEAKEQEERLKTFTLPAVNLDNERIASLQTEIEQVFIIEKEDKIKIIKKDVDALLEEEAMIKKFIIELREKMMESDTEIERLICEIDEAKKENEGVKGFVHFLALGIACGIILIEQIQN